MVRVHVCGGLVVGAIRNLLYRLWILKLNTALWLCTNTDKASLAAEEEVGDGSG